MNPNTISDWYCVAHRSAMWADGRKEMMRPPGLVGSRSTTARISAIRLRCVSCTPFGGPVVPDV